MFYNKNNNNNIKKKKNVLPKTGEKTNIKT